MPEVDEEDSDNEEEINISSEKKEKSREIVLDYLAEECQDVYRLEKWDSIYSLVVNYIRKKEEIEKSDSSVKKEELKKLRSEVVKEIKSNLEAEFNTSIGSSIQKIINFSYQSAIRTKRSLSFSSQTETSREETKMAKIDEEGLMKMETDSVEQLSQTEATPKGDTWPT